MVEGVDPDRCPLCGNENECGLRAGSKTCWCFSEKLLPGVLDSIPPEAQRAACLCKKCATGRDDLAGVSKAVEKQLPNRS